MTLGVRDRMGRYLSAATQSAPGARSVHIEALRPADSTVIHLTVSGTDPQAVAEAMETAIRAVAVEATHASPVDGAERPAVSVRVVVPPTDADLTSWGPGVGAVIGAACGLALAVPFFEWQRKRGSLLSVKDVEGVVGAPVIATLQAGTEQQSFAFLGAFLDARHLLSPRTHLVVLTESLDHAHAVQHALAPLGSQHPPLRTSFLSLEVMRSSRIDWPADAVLVLLVPAGAEPADWAAAARPPVEGFLAVVALLDSRSRPGRGPGARARADLMRCMDRIAPPIPDDRSAALPEQPLSGSTRRPRRSG